MSQPKKILQLTCSEHGQANVHLAVAHALTEQDPSVEIHIGSFSQLSNSVKGASDHVVKSVPGASPFHFHELSGTSYMDCILQMSLDFFSVIAIAPGLRNSLPMLKGLANCATPWNSDQFLEVYREIVRVIKSVDPDLVVVDNLFCPALSACRHLKRNWLVLSPNALKDFAGSRQPNLGGLWKYPK